MAWLETSGKVCWSVTLRTGKEELGDLGLCDPFVENQRHILLPPDQHIPFNKHIHFYCPLWFPSNPASEEI